MAKDLPAEVDVEIAAVQKRPMVLFELGLSSTIRFAAAKSNVVFPTGGNTYTAKAITVSGLSSSIEGQIQRVTVNFDNVKADMAAYAHAEDFRGKSLIIKRVYLDSLGNAANYNEIFNGYMEWPSDITRESLVVSATIEKPLNEKSLSTPYQRMCPWIFGGTECNTDSNADLTSLTASGTADSGSTTTLVDDALTQADDFWNYGEIQLTIGTKTYYRTVKDFVAGTDTVTFDVELPEAVDGTTTYVIYKGCDQTWDTCQANNNWGPSADNKLNFGGCIHVSSKAQST